MKPMQTFEQTLYEIVQFDNCYQNLYSGQYGSINNPTGSPDTAYKYEANGQMYIPPVPVEPIVFNNNEAYSRNNAMDYTRTSELYVRNLDFDRKDTFVEGRVGRTRGQQFDVNDISGRDDERRRNYNNDVVRDVMPDMPKSFDPCKGIKDYWDKYSIK